MTAYEPVKLAIFCGPRISYILHVEKLSSTDRSGPKICINGGKAAYGSGGFIDASAFYDAESIFLIYYIMHGLSACLHAVHNHAAHRNKPLIALISRLGVDKMR